MWLSRQMTAASGQDEAAVCTGIVTIGGARPSVMLGGERRELGVAGPGGIEWLPGVGDEVVVLRCDDGEQIIIASADNKGEGGGIRIRGDLYVEGRIFVNGLELGKAQDEA